MKEEKSGLEENTVDRDVSAPGGGAGASDAGGTAGFPVEPDYSIFDAPAQSPAPQGGEATRPGADICINIDRRAAGGGVAALATMAGFLLFVVVMTLILIITNGAVITTNQGRFAMFMGADEKDGDHFALSSRAGTTDSTQSGLLEIEDPPLSTKPVEQGGVLTDREIAKKVSPSVVSVIVSSRTSSGLASGIILTENGLIVTNSHVTEGMASIAVVTGDGRRFEAVLVGSDGGSDISVIKINASGLLPATFGNSNAVEVGDRAIAIGTPYDLGLMGTTTSGIISAVNRNVVINNREMSLIQTDASVNPGNSGGPLVNEYGHVIGVISLKIGAEYEGLGFAIPMNTAKEVIEQLVNKGSVGTSPMLGVDGRFLTAEFSGAYNLPVGMYIIGIIKNSDAYRKGLRTGDIITAVGGVKLTDLPGFHRAKAACRAGDAILLEIYRDDNLYDLVPGQYMEATVVMMDEAELYGGR